MHVINTEMGGLQVRVVSAGAEDKPEVVAVLCHGFGAPGTDLVGLGGEIFSMAPTLKGRVRFYFPAAPLSLEALGMFGARAWWHLDMEALEKSLQSGKPRIRRKEKPEGLPNARRHLLALVDDVQKQTRLPISKVVLGGFSQGSMLATDAALRMEEAPGGLCIFSGTLLSEDDWTRLAKKRAGLRVVQTHGRQDMLLAFDEAQALRDLLQKAGLKMAFHAFNDGHTIDMHGVKMLADLLDTVAKG
jgi:phospholipase/carboxylesterase